MPIVNGKYKNPGWLDNQAPPVSAQNLNDISTTLENLDAGGSGGGKRYASVVVGTSAAGWTAADCDYLCDGTDDQVEINQAIASLPSTGGDVLLLSGDYSLSAPISIHTHLYLHGSGKRQTTLSRASTNTPATPPSSNDTFLQWIVPLYMSELSDLSISGNSSLFTSAPAWHIVEVVAQGGSTVRNVEFNDCKDGAIYLDDGGYVENCTFMECPVGVYAGGASSSVLNNYFGLFVTSAVTAGWPTASAVTAVENYLICGNVCGDATIDLFGCCNSVISNNICSSIHLTASSGTFKGGRGNLITGNQPTGSSGVFITLGSNTGKNFVTGNNLNGSTGSGDYAVTIQDNGTGNIVRGNSDDTGGGNSTLVTLSASAWSNKQQTVTVAGVSANEGEQLITPTPAAASQSAYYAAGIRATAQAANSITFTADTVPTSNLSVYVVVQEVA